MRQAVTAMATQSAPHSVSLYPFPLHTLSTFSVGQEFNVICVKIVATSAARGNSFPLSEQILGKILFNLRIAVNKIEFVELNWLKQE